MSNDANYISIYGFRTEKDLDENNDEHIDSILEDDNHEEDIKSILAREKDNFYHITVESDDGKPLSF